MSRRYEPAESAEFEPGSLWGEYTMQPAAPLKDAGISMVGVQG
jgi:hypothetical protein